MQLIKLNELKPHVSNDYFFDDITGDNWTEFMKSVESSGVIEPVIITQNKVIVSGHQRVRACKELSITEVPCEIRIYDSEEKILKDLLETNLRQLGIGNTNPIKLSRCIIELEKIYGVRQGSFGVPSDGDNLREQKTQADLAEQFNMSERQLRDYKKLLTLIPELQDLIKDGDLSPTVGYKVLAKLPKEEQERLISDFGAEYISSLTQKKAQELINDIRQEKDELEVKLQTAIDKPAEIIDNTDHDTIKDLREKLKRKERDMKLLEQEKELLEREVELNKEDVNKFNELKTQIEFLNTEKDDIGRRIQSATELSGLVVKIDHVLKTELSPIRYSRTLERMDSDVAVENLRDIIESVESWCEDMRKFLPNNCRVIDVEVLMD